MDGSDMGSNNDHQFYSVLFWLLAVIKIIINEYTTIYCILFINIHLGYRKPCLEIIDEKYIKEIRFRRFGANCNWFNYVIRSYCIYRRILESK